MINVILYASFMVIGFCFGFLYDTTPELDMESGVYIVYAGDQRVGSGFKVGENKIVTAAHVCEHLRNIDEILIENDYDATGVTQLHMYQSGLLDACVLKTRIDPIGHTFELSDNEVEKYSRLYSYGYPRAERPILVLEAIVTESETVHAPFYMLNISMPSGYYIESTKELIGGMSGGPAVDKDGYVVGINARANRATKLSYFTPMYRVKEWIDGI